MGTRNESNVDNTPVIDIERAEAAENASVIGSKRQEKVLIDKYGREISAAQHKEKNIRTQILVMRQLPLVNWGMALFTFLVFSYMLYHFVLGRNQYGRLVVHEDSITWWMILLVLFSGMLTCTFAYSGKFKTTIFDRRLRYIELRKTTIFCRAKRTRGELSDLKAINCYKRGFKGCTFQSYTYQVKAEFVGALQPIILFESRRRDEIMKRVSVFLISNVCVDHND